MTEIKQSRYLFVWYIVGFVILSFVACLLILNLCTINIAEITELELLCAFMLSVGIDIPVALYTKYLYEKKTAKLYDDRIEFAGKVIKYKDVLDVNIDSTLLRNVSKVTIHSDKEQIQLVLNSFGFTTLFETMPGMKTGLDGQPADKIKLERKSAVDTMTIGVLNLMLYLTIALGIMVTVILTFRQHAGSQIVADFDRGYVWKSAIGVWVVVMAVKLISYVVVRQKYYNYSLNFYEDNMVVVFGKKILNNREVKIANVNAVLIKQSLVAKISGRYKLKLITDEVGSGVNDFDYFPYLLTEEEKDTVLKYLLGENAVECELVRSSPRSYVKSLIIGACLTALIVFVSAYYSWTFLMTLIPLWYTLTVVMVNKKYAFVGENLGVVGYGFTSNTLYYKVNKIESIEGDRDVVDKALRTYMTMIYFYGYKEQIFIGSFDKQLFHTLSSKLKK